MTVVGVRRDGFAQSDGKPWTWKSSYRCGLIGMLRRTFAATLLQTFKPSYSLWDPCGTSYPLVGAA